MIRKDLICTKKHLLAEVFLLSIEGTKIKISFPEDEPH